MAIPLLERWQAFGFYDFGKVWDRGSEPSASLASAGGGLRAWLVRTLSLELLLAKPLTRDSQRADAHKPHRPAVDHMPAGSSRGH